MQQCAGDSGFAAILDVHQECWSDNIFMREITRHILPHLRRPIYNTHTLVYRANMPIAIVGTPRDAIYPTMSRQSLHHAWIYCADNDYTYAEYVGKDRYEDAP